MSVDRVVEALKCRSSLIDARGVGAESGAGGGDETCDGSVEG